MKRYRREVRDIAALGFGSAGASLGLQSIGGVTAANASAGLQGLTGMLPAMGTLSGVGLMMRAIPSFEPRRKKR